MHRLDGRWIWDSWYVHHDGLHHAFYLQADSDLPEPDMRHFRVSVGHATSPDLRTWQVLPDALAPSEQPRWDDQATWTGSIVRGPDGRWVMFYTGASRAEDGLVQRIGAAQSEDLITWTRLETPVLEADPRWYERLDSGMWQDEAWRDPFVVADPGGDGWHMLITARSKEGERFDRGVIGHARSKDLLTWEVLPPLTRPGGFGQLEVPQVAVVGDQPVLLFSCHASELPPDRRPGVDGRGVWSVAGESLLGPFDVSRAGLFDHSSLYAARLVEDPAHGWHLMGFRNYESGRFVGELADPIPVELEDGQLVRREASRLR